MTSDAATGCVPPASGVMVSAVEFPLGLITESTELMTVVLTSASSVISLVPVALPETVYARAVGPAPVLSASSSCPGSPMDTENVTL